MFFKGVETIHVDDQGNFIHISKIWITFQSRSATSGTCLGLRSQIVWGLSKQIQVTRSCSFHINQKVPSCGQSQSRKRNTRPSIRWMKSIILTKSQPIFKPRTQEQSSSTLVLTLTVDYQPLCLYFLTTIRLNETLFMKPLMNAV